MRNISITTILCLLYFLSQCNSADDDSTEKQYKFNDTYTLRLVDSIKLPLDSVSTPGDCKQYFILNSKHYYAFDNAATNSIYIYDFTSKKLDRVVTLQKEGPKGIGEMEGFYIHNLDSIFIPSTQKQSLFLLNSKGVITDKFAYSKEADVDLWQISFQTNQPAILIKDSLYCFGSTGGKIENAKMCQILNLKTKKWSSRIGFPDSYKKGFFGMIKFYKPSYCFNPNTNRLVFSFPIDNSLYTHPIYVQQKMEKYYGGSSVFKAPKPLQFYSKIFPLDQEINYFGQYSSYAGIYYDVYNKFYYRVVEQPISEENLKSQDQFKRLYKNFSIVILNEKLVKVGEYTEIEKYSYGKLFIPTPKGLLLTNFKKSKQDENNMYFDIFKLVEKNAK